MWINFIKRLFKWKEIDTSNGECILCEENYFLNEGDKKCTKIENCSESTYGNCISCKHGYYLNKKENKCIKKDERFENCKLNIDGEICETCNLDYYFDDDNIWHIVIIAQNKK